MSDVRIGVQPGDGIVAHVGSGVLLVLPGGSEAMTDALLTVLSQTCGDSAAPGRTLSRRIAGHLVQADPDVVPPFAALAPSERGWAVILHGPVEVRIAWASGEERLFGRDAATWVDRILDDAFDAITVGSDEAAAPEVDERLDLTAGIVPGSGLVLSRAGVPAVPGPSAPGTSAPAGRASPAAAARSEVAEDAPTLLRPIPQPEPVAQPALLPLPPVPPAPAPTATPAPVATAEPAGPVDSEEDIPFESISLFDIDGSSARAPLPILGTDAAGEPESDEPEGTIVDGILCERGHFNHPFALYCSSCGVSTVHRTRTTVKGPRPTLGVVVTDDGTTYTLDADYIVGREPEREPSVQSGHVRLLKLQDPERSISRVHAEIRLLDWDVFIVDRGSANGTFVAARDEVSWKRLPAGKPEKVMPGTRVAFGRRVMTYDTHHQA